jgi:nucleotide-binding universal stress UspA family protein
VKILLAADGSEYTRHAARRLIALARKFAQPPEIHLITVHAPLPGRATAALPKGASESFHREECEAALSVAEAEFKAAGVAYRPEWRVGEVAHEIATYAAGAGIELIVMGSHGKGALASALLGSVAVGVLKATKVPVLIVRD